MNCDPDIKALSRSIEILSDYKRVLKKNEELKREIERQKDINTIINKKEIDKYYEKVLEKTMTKFLNDNIANDFIPKKKVKDKIEKLQDDLKYIACRNSDCNKCFTEYRGSNFIYCYAYHQIKVLDELLESEEK